MCVVGAGPAGLMAAEVLSGEGMQVDVFDGMPSVGRKFLLAGKGGLNLTHSESAERFASRYGARSQWPFRERHYHSNGCCCCFFSFGPVY